jgi:hypothetical protein
MPKTLKPAGWKNFRIAVDPKTGERTQVHLSRTAAWKALGFTIKRSK